MSEEKKQSINVSEVDFDNVYYLSNFVTDTGKILPGKITGFNAAQQRRLTKAIKRSRSMLLMK